jgi:hypothetical protein
MRKNYVKPSGSVVALQMDENIALSLGFIDVIYNFTLSYNVVNGVKYIKNTDVASAGLSGNLGATYDIFVLVDTIVDRITSTNPVTGWENCNTDPSVNAVEVHLD